MKQGVHQRLVVHEEGELSSFQQEPKVMHEGVSSQSSLSKAEYLDSAVESFLEKKANEDQEPRIFCWRMALRWESKASTVRET